MSGYLLHTLPISPFSSIKSLSLSLPCLFLPISFCPLPQLPSSRFCFSLSSPTSLSSRLLPKPPSAVLGNTTLLPLSLPPSCWLSNPLLFLQPKKKTEKKKILWRLSWVLLIFMVEQTFKFYFCAHGQAPSTLVEDHRVVNYHNRVHITLLFQHLIKTESPVSTILWSLDQCWQFYVHHVSTTWGNFSDLWDICGQIEMVFIESSIHLCKQTHWNNFWLWASSQNRHTVSKKALQQYNTQLYMNKTYKKICSVWCIAAFTHDWLLDGSLKALTSGCLFTHLADIENVIMLLKCFFNVHPMHVRSVFLLCFGLNQFLRGNICLFSC